MDLLPQFAAVVVAFAIMGLTLWFLHKRGALQVRKGLPFNLSVPRSRTTSKTKLLEQADRLQLSPTHSISVIKMGERAILLGISPAGFYLVESSPWKNLQGASVESTGGAQS
jgi:flagellar biogenesis protein FliO